LVQLRMDIKNGFVVGNTPLIQLNSFSERLDAKSSRRAQSGWFGERPGSALHYSRSRRKGLLKPGGTVVGNLAILELV